MPIITVSHKDSAPQPDEGLDYLVEIRTRWTQSRSESLQERTDRVRIALEKLDLERFGVWIELPQAGWAQASADVTP